MGGICTPLRLAQQVQVGCWLLLDKGTEFKSSSYEKYLGAVSCHHKADLCSSQHNLFAKYPADLGCRTAALPIFLYGRLQTTPCNMLLHKQLLAFILLSQLWKKEHLLTFFSQKNISKYALGVHVYTRIHAYIKIISKGERNVQEHEETVWQKTNADMSK